MEFKCSINNEYYTPLFVWEGKKPKSKRVCAEIESAILRNINAFARHINPHIDEWNESYTGPQDQTAEDGDLKATKDSVYLTYMYNNMVEKMRSFVPTDVTLLAQKNIKEWTVNDEMVLAARTYTGALVGIYWKPVEI